ncbi:MAG: cell division protein FtsQ/DivIB, partial [Clostridia bacterium]|nr:cell division protein FtsQ/DivIB [Clostridia bacterium]
EKQFPDSVILYVKERVPRANVQVMGVTYQMDEEGMILERLGNVQPSGDLITVTGFQTREIRVGSPIVATMASQMDAYEGLMQEVILQGFSDQVSELNLSNPDSLYLITKDGYTAHLGDGTELRAKIGTVRAVVAKLREMRRNGGMLEASVPGVATYMPMDD